MKFKYLLLSLAMFAGTFCLAGEKYNFNSDWLLKVGDIPSAEKTSFNDRDWEKVTLPHAFNEDEAFKNDIRDLTKPEARRCSWSSRAHARESTSMSTAGSWASMRTA